ncbi:hypothetical protein CC86DRAFT_253567, partial [Ophiobolus disseminans]
FFDYLHKRGWSLKLQHLIICSYVMDRMELEHRHVHCPQYRFVKGFQRDILGRSAAVAVPVTRAMIKDFDNCAKILKHDPAC